MLINSELQNVLEKLGKNIEKRLKEIGMTRKALAEKVGVSQNSISGYIRGTQLPKFDKLYNISVALDTSLSELTGGDVYSLQTKESIERAKKQAVKEYELTDAIQILEGVGWECYRKENGAWELFRQKTFNDFLEIITDGAKIKRVQLTGGDETLITLARMVKQGAIEHFNSTSAIKDLNAKLDEILSVEK